VDLYSARWHYGRRSGHRHPRRGTHTALIEWTGTKNRKASNTHLVVDAFDVVGELQPVRHEQTDSLLTYGGPWRTASSKPAPKGTPQDRSGRTLAADGWTR